MLLKQFVDANNNGYCFSCFFKRIKDIFLFFGLYKD